MSTNALRTQLGAPLYPYQHLLHIRTLADSCAGIPAHTKVVRRFNSSMPFLQLPLWPGMRHSNRCCGLPAFLQHSLVSAPCAAGAMKAKTRAH
jgi:hypothetical protein